MTDREKMIEAINSVQAYGIMSNAFGGHLPVTNEMLADALIAAGIGDTTNIIVENEVLQRDVDNLMRTLEEGTEEFQEVQHRADVAERALFDFYKKMLAIPSYALAVNGMERLLQ